MVSKKSLLFICFIRAMINFLFSIREFRTHKSRDMTIVVQFMRVTCYPKKKTQTANNKDNNQFVCVPEHVWNFLWMILWRKNTRSDRPSYFLTEFFGRILSWSNQWLILMHSKRGSKNLFAFKVIVQHITYRILEAINNIRKTKNILWWKPSARHVVYYQVFRNFKQKRVYFK